MPGVGGDTEFNLRPWLYNIDESLNISGSHILYMYNKVMTSNSFVKW